MLVNCMVLLPRTACIDITDLIKSIGQCTTVFNHVSLSHPRQLIKMLMSGGHICRVYNSLITFNGRDYCQGSPYIEGGN